MNDVENKLPCENPEGFVIDNAEKAEWALKKIRDERESRDYLIDACKKEIERLQTKIKETEDKCDAKTSWLLSKLDQYLDEDGVPARTTKTQKKLELPSGKIIRKLESREICVARNGNTGTKLKEDEELLEFIKENYPEDIVVKESCNWKDFKSKLMITDEGDIITEDGLSVDCLFGRIVPPSVDVKVDC